MATWIELRCEERGPGISGPLRCLSDDNDGPMGLAYDDNASILFALKEIRDHAKKSGWIRRKDGWVCPKCAKRLALASDTDKHQSDEILHE